MIKLKVKINIVLDLLCKNDIRLKEERSVILNYSRTMSRKRTTILEVISCWNLDFVLNVDSDS